MQPCSRTHQIHSKGARRMIQQRIYLVCALTLLMAVGAIRSGPSFAAPPHTPETAVSQRPVSGGIPASSGAASPTIEHNLTRLAEVMGSLAWLRDLCGAGDAHIWRDRISALVEAESVLPERKERLAGAYNSGYRAYSLTYKQCTPSAELAIQRYLREGASLTRALSSRIAR